MNKFKVVLLAGVCAFLIPQDSRATLLNLTPPAAAPDFMAGFMNVSYTPDFYAPGSGQFLASGWTTDYANGSAVLWDTGEYTLTAAISSAGLLTGGSLTINGDIGAGSETLLSGNLITGTSGTAFGFENGGGNIFEFLFTVTGVNPGIVADFGGLGTPGGVILNANFVDGDVPFDGTWTSAFSNSGSGNAVSDNFAAVPESTPGCLLGVGLLALAVTLRRSDRARATSPVSLIHFLPPKS